VQRRWAPAAGAVWGLPTLRYVQLSPLPVSPPDDLGPAPHLPGAAGSSPTAGQAGASQISPAAPLALPAAGMPPAPRAFPAETADPGTGSPAQPAVPVQVASTASAEAGALGTALLQRYLHIPTTPSPTLPLIGGGRQVIQRQPPSPISQVIQRQPPSPISQVIQRQPPSPPGLAARAGYQGEGWVGGSAQPEAGRSTAPPPPSAGSSTQPAVTLSPAGRGWQPLTVAVQRQAAVPVALQANHLAAVIFQRYPAESAAPAVPNPFPALPWATPAPAGSSVPQLQRTLQPHPGWAAGESSAPVPGQAPGALHMDLSLASAAPAASTPAVQRRPETAGGPGAEMSAANPSPGGSTPPETATAPAAGGLAAPDPEELVDKLWQKLMQRLAIESERRGWLPWA
jgi:hypothetical protein